MGLFVYATIKNNIKDGQLKTTVNNIHAIFLKPLTRGERKIDTSG
jgi:hypothetical protein